MKDLSDLPKNILFSIHVPPVSLNGLTPIKIIPTNAIYFPYHPENATNRLQHLTWLGSKSRKSLVNIIESSSYTPAPCNSSLSLIPQK
jgi:hypothetical protein